MRALPDSVAFSALSIIFNFIVMVFFVGDILMSARLILVGIFAIIDRLRRPHREASPGYHPRVAVLIPAYNEEKVIVRTIRSVLHSDYDESARHCDRRRLERPHRQKWPAKPMRPRFAPASSRCSPSPMAARRRLSTTRSSALKKNSMSASMPIR